MKVEYNNLYTHFVFTTLNRMPLILEKNRDRIEKYITGIVNNNACHLYAIYANPEHVHFLVSRAPNMDEESLATIIANSSERFINNNRLCVGLFQWQQKRENEVPFCYETKAQKRGCLKKIIFLRQLFFYAHRTDALTMQLFRSCFFNHHSTAFVFGSVQFFNRSLPVTVICHFDESKSF